MIDDISKGIEATYMNSIDEQVIYIEQKRTRKNLNSDLGHDS